ncbi:leucyl/phenylalanyl-tRNA--protein transferase [Pistricoccus aurantiacus]|uniref:Leucyl/phenylalanyl-tRNA--protein transferase n=1 Tax=Pistricoccus aurantiacus TaxID=1883414 RepID=A0A5B8SQM9_9GAMM|nr:leucyl/phenylalanyl-tRNA--protein transferase [Pistricoccus aurantiacus]QEA39442.1 leucyl/phenylalanyl-tRNA--protein transferase [Pistricoccus aurantiacus]
MVPWLPPRPIVFPSLKHALHEPNGLLAAGGELSPPWLLAAYRRGIFPWFSQGQPILWWSPDPRMVLLPEELKISRSLGKRLRNAGFCTTFDQDFIAVIDACAQRPADDALPAGQTSENTWITPEMRAAYIALHRLGHAHSIEVWQDRTLVGGLYGVALGKIFFGESMFSRHSDASKIALVHLVEHMRRRGGRLIDCQMHTAHLANLGARDIARARFIDYLEQYADGNASSMFDTVVDPC